MNKLASALLIILFYTNAIAQDHVEEIVVTGSRLDRYSSEDIPLITLQRNADYVLLSVSIENDTRNTKMRIDELRKTVLSLTTAANKRSDLELSALRVIEDDYDDVTFLVPFTTSMIDALTVNGYRSDTSKIDIVIKSPVGENDTDLSSLYERITKFYKSIPVEGRTIMTDNKDPTLSIANIEKYRRDLLFAIKADMAKHKTLLGQTSAVRISGLENSLRWVRKGELALEIYVPYQLTYVVN